MKKLDHANLKLYGIFSISYIELLCQIAKIPILILSISYTINILAVL